MSLKKPILVTGSHRSGTTWVGRMLAASPSVAYIQEPLHINHDRGVCGAHFDQWFTYISEENEHKYYKHIKRTIDFRYNLAAKLKKAKRFRDIKAAWEQQVRFKVLRHLNVRPLLKDPIAIFSAEWLASKFGMEVVVLIRHPAAFAASLKVKNWTFNFLPFLDQPLLLRDHLQDYEDEIREFRRSPGNIISQATLLWRCLHAVILKYRDKHPDWIFIRHEDLSRDPLKSFQTLYHRLDIPFTDPVAEVIQSHSLVSQPKELYENGNRLKRDSLSNIRTWKNRLTDEEIKYISGQVHELSQYFYSEDDWF